MKTVNSILEELHSEAKLRTPTLPMNKLGIQNGILESLDKDEKYSNQQDFDLESEAKSFVSNHKEIDNYEIRIVNTENNQTVFRVLYDVKKEDPLRYAHAFWRGDKNTKSRGLKWVKDHKKYLKGLTLYFIGIKGSHSEIPYQETYYIDKADAEARCKHMQENNNKNSVRGKSNRVEFEVKSMVVR